VKTLGQVQKLEMPSAILDCGVRGCQFAQAAAIDICDLSHIQQYVPETLIDLAADSVAQSHVWFACRDPSPEFEDHYAIYIPAMYLQAHREFPLLSSCVYVVDRDISAVLSDFGNINTICR
jgi:hypothetical protein